MVAACPFPSPRGTPTRILRLAEALSQRGHEVHVVTYHLGDPKEVLSLKIHRTLPLKWYRKESPGPTWTKLLLLDPLLTIKLHNLLKRLNADIVHAHHYEGILAAILAARKKNIPLVYDAHTMLASELPSYGFLGSGWVSKKIGEYLDRHVPPRSNHVVAVTQTIKNNLVGRGILSDDLVTVVINGIEPEMFGPLDNEVDRAGSEPGNLVIFTGNVARYQGLDLLFNAFRVVVDKYPRARLLIATDKAFATFDQLEKQARVLEIRDHLDIVATTSLEHVRELLAGADVAVNPRTDCEGIPQKLLNYMAAGKAIVSFEGSAPILRHGVTGLTVPNGSVVEFADGIIRLLKDSELRHQLGTNARQHVKSNFNWQTAALELEHIYARLMIAR